MKFLNLFKTSNNDLFIASLDGLRACAVLIVFLSHTSNSGIYFLPFLDLSKFGQYGVMIFFFLSAFLLSRPFFSHQTLIVYIKEENSLTLNLRELKRYLLRRLLRIAPLYYFVLFIDFFYLKIYFRNKNDPRILINHLTFQDGISVFWSIPVEMTFYLILPFLLLIFHVLSQTNFRTTLLSLGIVVWIGVMSYFDLFYLDLSRSFIQTFYIHPYVPFFIMGMFTSLIYTKHPIQRMNFNKKLLFEILAMGSAIILILQIPSVWFTLNGQDYSFIKANGAPKYLEPRFILMLLATSIFVYSYLNGIGYVKYLLSFGPLRFIGKISFSFYLLHSPVIYWIEPINGLNGITKAILIFLITLVLSSITFLAIEQPFARLLGRKNSNKSIQPDRKVAIVKGG